jgi:DUF1365 family protein
MDMGYVFRGRAPSETVSLAIDGLAEGRRLIATALRGRRRPLTDASILAATAAIPLLTLKVIVAIHWEALKLWLKGVSLVPRPAPLRKAVRGRPRRAPLSASPERRSGTPSASGG